jgi:hypothetical protein
MDGWMEVDKLMCKCMYVKEIHVNQQGKSTEE